MTARCKTYHDGGDGTCVPPGTCSSGYALDSTGTCVKNTTGLKGSGKLAVKAVELCVQ